MNRNRISEKIRGRSRCAVPSPNQLGRRCGFTVEEIATFPKNKKCGAIAAFDGVIADAVANGMMMCKGERVALTMRGRMLSNEVFSRFLGVVSTETAELSLSR